MSLRDAAARMTEEGATSVLVRLDGADELGIVTDQDLRSRVVAEGLPYDTPIGEVMTTPVVTVGTDANGADVLLAMLDHGIRHLPVVSARGEVLGVISDLDLLAAETRTPFVLRRAIADAHDVDELRRAARRLNPTLIGLHQFELPPAQISAVISVVADALIRRTIELVVASVGPPPPTSPGCRWAARDGARPSRPPTSTRASSGRARATRSTSATCTRSPTRCSRR